MIGTVGITIQPEYQGHHKIIYATIKCLLEISGWRTARSEVSTFVDYGTDIPASSPSAWAIRADNRMTSVNGLKLPAIAVADDARVDWVLVACFFLTGEHEWQIVNGTKKRVPALAAKKWGLDRSRIVEVAAANLAKILEQRNGCPPPRPRWPEGKKFAVALTHDCDRVYRYRPRTYLSEANDWLMRRELKLAILQSAKAVYSTAARLLNEDPCLNAWKALIDWQINKRIPSATYSGTWSRFDEGSDRNDLHYAYRDPNVIASLKSCIDAGNEVGIHFSINAHTCDKRMVQELDRFSEAYGIQPTGARGHFWSLNPEAPEDTLKILFQDCGLRYDSSFGMSNVIGFRRGIGFPYEPFDPNTGSGLGGIELPPIAMDEAVFKAGSDPASWTCAMQDIIQDGRQSGGLVMLNWHTDAMMDGYMGNHFMHLVPIIEELRDESDCWIAKPAEIAAWSRVDRWS